MTEDKEKQLKISIDNQYKEIKPTATRIRIDAAREKICTYIIKQREGECISRHAII